MGCRAHLILLLAILCAASPAVAQEKTPEPEDTNATAAKKKWTVSWDERPSVRYGNRVRIDARARFSTDLRDSGAPSADDDESRFDIARRRIGVSGSIGRVADFQVERE